MTKEEASRILNDYDVNFEGHDARDVANALDMAIESLERDVVLDKAISATTQILLEDGETLVFDYQGKRYRLTLIPSQVKQQERQEKEMTKEEAIARIKDHMIVHKMNEPRAIYISEALNMAISALEDKPQYYPPCEDCHTKMDEIRKVYDKATERVDTC